MKQTEVNVSSTETVNQSWRRLYCISGILLIITAVVWTIVSRTASVLYASGYPSDPASYLQLISQHQLLAYMTWSLWIVSDFMLFAPTVALYIILQRYNRTLALLGSMFAMFFNVYDICVTELNSLTLVSLAHGYASVATESLKASFVTAAAYGYYALPIQTVLSFATGTFGYLAMVRANAKEHLSQGNCDIWHHCDGCCINRVGSPLVPIFHHSRTLSIHMCPCLRFMVCSGGSAVISLWKKSSCQKEQCRKHDGNRYMNRWNSGMNYRRMDEK
jgi:hypothetical protein